MTRALVVLVAVVAIATIAAAFAPASLVAARLEAASQGRLRLTQAQGTVWNGRADATFTGAAVTLPLAWRIAPWPLLRGEAHVALLRPAGDLGVRAALVVAPDRLEARDLDARVPAAALRLPPGSAAGGEVHVTAATLAWSRERADGRAQAVWTPARLQLPGAMLLDLGRVEAALAADGARWRGPLTARGGMLHIDGDASVDDQGADIALTIVAQPGAPDALRQWLGPADAQGAVRMRFTPRFR